MWWNFSIESSYVSFFFSLISLLPKQKKTLSNNPFRCDNVFFTTSRSIIWMSTKLAIQIDTCTDITGTYQNIFELIKYFYWFKSKPVSLLYFEGSHDKQAFQLSNSSVWRSLTRNTRTLFFSIKFVNSIHYTRATKFGNFQTGIKIDFYGKNHGAGSSLVCWHPRGNCKICYSASNE